MRAVGYWRGCGEFVLVTDFITGARTVEDMLAEGKQLPPSLRQEAEKVRKIWCEIGRGPN